MSPDDFESFDPSGRRMSAVVQERRRVAAAQPLRQSDLGRRGVEQVATPDDEVDALAQVVDDDAERRTSSGRADRGSADLRSARRRRHTGRRGRPSTSRSHRPRRPATPGPSRLRDHDTIPDSPCRTRTGHPLVAQARERRPRAVAPVHEPIRVQSVVRSGVRGERVGIALADRAEVRLEAEPGQVFEERGVVRWPAALPVVILDPQEDPPTDGPRPRPRSRPRWPRGRDADTRSGPARTGSGRRAAGPTRLRPIRRDRRLAVAIRRPDRASRARESPRTAAGRGPEGRPGAAVPRSPSRPAAGPRARARHRGWPVVRPPPSPDRPRGRASARSFSSATSRRSRASIRRRSRRSSAVSAGRRRSATGAPEPPGDRLQGQVIAARALADDRFERRCRAGS